MQVHDLLGIMYVLWRWGHTLVSRRRGIIKTLKHIMALGTGLDA
jgi:hypothetical protein